MDRATPKEKATLPPSHSSNRLSQQLASAFSPPHSSGQLPWPAAACVHGWHLPTGALHLHVWGASSPTAFCMMSKKQLSSLGLRLTAQVSMPPCSCTCAGCELPH